MGRRRVSTEWGPYADSRIQDIIHVMASAYHQRFGAHEGGAPYAAEKIGAENSLTNLLDWLELEDAALAKALRWGTCG